MLHMTLGISFLFSQQLEWGDTSVFTPILQIRKQAQNHYPLLVTSRGKELGSEKAGVQPSPPSLAAHLATLFSSLCRTCCPFSRPPGLVSGDLIPDCAPWRLAIWPESSHPWISHSHL